MERMTSTVAIKLWMAICEYGEVTRTGNHVERARALCDMRETFHELTGHKPVAQGNGWVVKTLIDAVSPLN